MTTLKKLILIGLISSSASMLIACSDEQDTSKEKASGDHVWKTQTDALQSAKDVAEKAQKSLNEQTEKLNESD